MTGWGVVDWQRGALRHVDCGTVRLPAGDGTAGRLARLYDEILALIERFAPSVVAIERNFVARNVQSAFRLGEARGVILAAVARVGVTVQEVTPAAVKLAAVGHGAADKASVTRGVTARLGLAAPPPADAADALAVALCWLQQAPLQAAIARAVRSGA